MAAPRSDDVRRIANEDVMFCALALFHPCIFVGEDGDDDDEFKRKKTTTTTEENSNEELLYSRSSQSFYTWKVEKNKNQFDINFFLFPSFFLSISLSYFFIHYFLVDNVFRAHASWNDAPRWRDNHRRHPSALSYPLFFYSSEEKEWIQTSASFWVYVREKGEEERERERERQRLDPIASGDRVDHVKALALSMSAISWQITGFTVTKSAGQLQREEGHIRKGRFEKDNQHPFLFWARGCWWLSDTVW